MMLAYEDIEGYLHYYARRFQNFRFEYWELINEAWIVAHGLNKIQFASQGIRWAMISYKARENQLRRQGSSTARVLPLWTDAGINKLVGDMLAKPNSYVPSTDTIDNIDTISWLADNARLSLDARILLDQRFGRGMTLREIAEDRHCTSENIRFKIKGIITKLCEAARRLERRELLVSAG